MRYAIYFTPRQDEPLARLAANWLGRDPFGAATRPVEAVGDLSAAEVAFHTASARRVRLLRAGPWSLRTPGSSGRSAGGLVSQRKYMSYLPNSFKGRITRADGCRSRSRQA